MKHFVFQGNIDFAADDQGALCDVLIHRLWNRTISELRAISHANGTKQHAQQVAGNSCRQKFSAKNRLEKAG